MRNNENEKTTFDERSKGLLPESWHEKKTVFVKLNRKRLRLVEVV